MIYNVNAVIGYIAIHDQKINNSIESDLTLTKLQKLLYYLQGHFLAIHNKPLFENEIYHCMYGFTVVDVYHNLKNKTTAGGLVSKFILDNKDNFNYDLIGLKDRECINKVLSFYCQFSPSKLFKMVISEDLYKNTKNNEIIKQEDLKSFFSMPFMTGRIKD